MTSNNLKIIEESFNTQIEVKRSKFISFLTPFSNFKELYENLKEAHPKASHIVYAYRYLNSYNQIEENLTDDGEPKGCAGVPTLNALRGANLIECALITVRYFGGIKLGRGGMVRAYSASANSVIDLAPLLPYTKKRGLKIKYLYTNSRHIEYLIKRVGLEVKARGFEDESPTLELYGDSSKLEEFLTLVDSYLLDFSYNLINEKC